MLPLQTFRTTDNPAILFNGNNEYLHYEDTWYILGYKPDTYVVRVANVSLLRLLLSYCGGCAKECRSSTTHGTPLSR